MLNLNFYNKVKRLPLLIGALSISSFCQANDFASWARVSKYRRRRYCRHSYRRPQVWTIVAAVLIAVALYVVENYGGNGFVPSWDQIYQRVGLEPSQSETTAPLRVGIT